MLETMGETKKRVFDPSDPESWVARARNIIQQIEDLEQQAHGAGMVETAHILNAAKNKAGWELARFVETKMARRK